MATIVGIPIAALPAADVLTGDELVPIAQGVSGAVKQTTSGAFVTLASGVIVPVAVAAAVAAAVPAATAAAIAAIVPVTNAEMADMAQATVKGRAAGAGTGAPQDLTQAQLTALINAFSSALSGAVPASGGGTANFLRADGAWAPAGGGGGGVTIEHSFVTPEASVNIAGFETIQASVVLTDVADGDIFIFDYWTAPTSDFPTSGCVALFDMYFAANASVVAGKLGIPFTAPSTRFNGQLFAYTIGGDDFIKGQSSNITDSSSSLATNIEKEVTLPNVTFDLLIRNNTTPFKCLGQLYRIT